MNYQEKMDAAALDVEYSDQTVESVMTDDGCVVNFVSGTALIIRNEHDLRLPVAGDKLRLFGRGLGYVVRGIGLVDFMRKLAGLYRYETAEEEEISHLRSVEESNKKKQTEWAEKADETARRVADMPGPFRERFEFFMRRSEWGWNFGPYELFCCEEAIKIAAALHDKDAIAAFAGLSVSRQKECVPNLVYKEHSGNTFGAACKLAHCYVAEPDLIPKMHGALCPLVGCGAYGCWSTVASKEKPKEKA